LQDLFYTLLLRSMIPSMLSELHLLEQGLVLLSCSRSCPPAHTQAAQPQSTTRHMSHRGKIRNSGLSRLRSVIKVKVFITFLCPCVSFFLVAKYQVIYATTATSLQCAFSSKRYCIFYLDVMRTDVLIRG